MSELIRNLMRPVGWRWLCSVMGWHRAPMALMFDGCSFVGTCPRCGNRVLRDSQGNWFTARPLREDAR